MINTIFNENCLTGLKKLEDKSVDCIVTSPPYYGLRDYGTGDQIGLEETPEIYVAALVEVFTECKRVLKDEGTLWLNLGDSYAASGGKQVEQTVRKSDDFVNAGQNGGGRSSANNKLWGVKPKDLIGIPWAVAFALRSSGWYLRQDIIWSKPNPMPESVTDRCTKAHEYIFLLSKSARYYYDADAIKTGSLEVKDYSKTHKVGNKRNPDKLNNGFRPRDHPAIYEMANKRSVWTVQTMAYSEAHFATFPERLITDMIKAGCPVGGTVLDPFMGAGTTALVARKLDRNYLGFELNPAYIRIANKRLQDQLGMFI